MVALTDRQIFDAIRARKGSGLSQIEVDAINTIMYPPGRVTPDEPGFLKYARSMVGQREIVGPKHNSWIAKGWARLGAGWYNDDETPWCGFFVADCLDRDALPYPKNFPAAASFRTYGEACSPQVGAIGVKARTGGNHVFFIVGETVDKQFYKALGGNQSNMVNIMDIRKSDVTDIRWPPGIAQTRLPLPTVLKGKISSNER